MSRLLLRLGLAAASVLAVVTGPPALAARAPMVRISSSGGGARFEVLDRIEPGPIAAFASDGPVRSAAAPELAAVKRAEARSGRLLAPDGPVEALSSGVRQHGEVIAQAPVVHGLTGVLRSDVTTQGLFGTLRFPAGQYVYGVPMMNSAGEEQITWCAPRAAEGHPNRFSTTCFPAIGAGYGWTLSPTPLMATTLIWPGNLRPDVVGLSVERRPASLGAPMKLTYVFDKWRTVPLRRPAMLAASIGVEIRVNGEMSPVDHLYVSPDQNGVVRLPSLNGLLVLGAVDKQGAPLVAPGDQADPNTVQAFLSGVDEKKVRLEVVVPPTAADGALPIGGAVHLRLAPGRKPGQQAKSDI